MSIRSLVRAQAATGVWAVVDRRSFELVTGRKTDYWLVKTVGVLAAAIGATLLVAARDEHPSAEALVLAVGAGASFTLVDVVYVARRRIGPVYLGDAALHVALALAAVAARRRAREAPPTETR